MPEQGFRYYEFEKRFLRAVIRSKMMSIEEFARAANVNVNTLYAILTRNPMSETTWVEMETARLILSAIDRIPTVFSVTYQRQGPRRLPADLKVDMTTTPEERIASFHRMREAAKPKVP